MIEYIAMRIVIDIRLLGHGGNSGIKEYTRLLTEELTAHDKKNEYLLFYGGVHTVRLPSSWLARPNVSLVDWRIPNKLLDASSKFFHTPHIDKVLGADIVYSPNLNILRTQKKCRIMTFHDLSFTRYPSFFSLRQRAWHALQDWQTEAKRARHLIADSLFTKSDLVALGLPEENISVIYPGIHSSFRTLDARDPAREALRHTYKLTRPFLLALGTLEPRKNIPAAIRAFTLLKEKAAFADMQFVIAGNRGWLYQDILREARTSPVAKDILFIGPVADSERVVLYNEARGVIYPSFLEGFGFPPLEAQACGCPVVVTNRTSLPEIIGESGITRDPWNIALLRDALETILTDGKERDELIARGYENARRFTWQKTAEQLRDVFTTYKT